MTFLFTQREITSRSCSSSPLQLSSPEITIMTFPPDNKANSNVNRRNSTYFHTHGMQFLTSCCWPKSLYFPYQTSNSFLTTLRISTWCYRPTDIFNCSNYFCRFRFLFFCSVFVFCFLIVFGLLTYISYMSLWLGFTKQPDPTHWHQ